MSKEKDKPIGKTIQTIRKHNKKKAKISEFGQEIKTFAHNTNRGHVDLVFNTLNPLQSFRESFKNSLENSVKHGKIRSIESSEELKSEKDFIDNLQKAAILLKKHKPDRRSAMYALYCKCRRKKLSE